MGISLPELNFLMLKIDFNELNYVISKHVEKFPHSMRIGEKPVSLMRSLKSALCSFNFSLCSTESCYRNRCYKSVPGYFKLSNC